MQASHLAILLTLYCTMPCNSGYTIHLSPEGRQIFYDGDTCMYYCNAPCLKTPAYDGPDQERNLYYCFKFNPDGAGMNGWLQLALVIIGVLSSYCGCNAVYWIYLWQKGRPSVKPSGVNAWNGIVEEKPKEAPNDVLIEEGETVKADVTDVAKTDHDAAKDNLNDAGEKLKDVIHV